jgi:hypothetical protein
LLEEYLVAPLMACHEVEVDVAYHQGVAAAAAAAAAGDGSSRVVDVPSLQLRGWSQRQQSLGAQTVGSKLVFWIAFESSPLSRLSYHHLPQTQRFGVQLRKLPWMYRQ